MRWEDENELKLDYGSEGDDSFEFENNVYLLSEYTKEKNEHS
jgi:hypothetical protein